MAYPRTYAYRLMVAAPAFLLLSIGVSARRSHPEFVFVASTPQQDRDLDAYASIIEEGKAFIQPNPIVVDPSLPRRLAARWVKEHQAGKLKTLDMIDIGDTSDDGAKASIVATNQATVAALNHVASEELLQNQGDKAAEDAMLAIRCSETIKYFDFGSMRYASSSERRSIGILYSAVANMSTQAKQRLVADLRSIPDGNSTIRLMIANTRRLYAQSQMRLGKQPERIVEATRLVDANDLMTYHRKHTAGYSPALLASSSVQAPDMVWEMRTGSVSAQETILRIGDLIDTIKKSCVRPPVAS